MSDPVPEQRVNKKKLENLERLKKKKEVKISKNKQKKLAQIADRKKIKQTRESLFEELQQYQLDAECMKLLGSISGHKTTPTIDANGDTIEERNSSANHKRKKLRCVSKEQLEKAVVKRHQKGYIETDSSSSSAESGDNEDKDGDDADNLEEDGPDPEIQILDSKHPSSGTNFVESRKELTFDNSELILQKIREEEAEKARENKKKLRQAQANYYEILAKIKGKHVFLERDEMIEKQRRLLPINAEEQSIVEAINEHPIVIVCGETGSGKTTQVPQFLYEAGYTSNGHLIGVTEPRRIAAISMANRVGEELAAPELAAYQIRYEGNRTEQTKILFMTDGVLLKELQSDCTLSRFSVIIIDEAHERSIYSDVLIGLLSRICLARLKKQYPLKLIIMSATLRLNDFLQESLFPNIRPKVLNVDARQFPVSIYFERRTPEDHLEAAFKKVCKIHEQYPPGGILVFLSGQNEVHHLIKLLERRYPRVDSVEESKNVSRKRPHSKKGKRRFKEGKNGGKNEEDNDKSMTLDYDEFGIYDMDEEAERFAEPEGGDEMAADGSKFPPLHCLPLYSLLPGPLQKRVFAPPPVDGSRLCVVSTNVAETSLTIPNICYVVDSGKEKRRDYDPVTGVSRFVVGWCSQASANQRSGRAGRVRSGYAFRLYSSALYEDMPAHSSPEILNKPIEQLVLFLKSMGFSKLTNFPFPTRPRPEQIGRAESRLARLGAIATGKNKTESSSQITPLGCTLVQIPLAPGFAKVLVCSSRQGLLPYTVTLVSALSVREPLIPVSAIQGATMEETKAQMAEMLKQRRLWCSIGEAKMLGDLTVILHVIGAADYENMKDHKTLCSLGLRPKALDEINKLRNQLVDILNTSNSLKEKLPREFRMKPPGQEQMKKMREILVSCFPEKIAKRMDEGDLPKGAYKAQVLEEFVFIDSASMLFKEQPDFVLYQEIVQVAEKKVMQNLVVVEAQWIPDFVNFNGILGRF